MKKLSHLALAACLALALGACSKGPAEETQNPSSSEVVEDDQGQESNPEEEVVTRARLKAFEDEEIDDYGNKEALFEDQEGQEFIAIISGETSLEGELSPGEEYEVHHSQVMTMSLPGKYSEVSLIKKIDQ